MSLKPCEYRLDCPIFTYLTKLPTIILERKTRNDDKVFQIYQIYFNQLRIITFAPETTASIKVFLQAPCNLFLSCLIAEGNEKIA